MRTVKTRCSKLFAMLLVFLMAFALIPSMKVSASETNETVEATTYEVTVNVAPSTAEVTFYSGEDASTQLDTSAVKDNGVVNEYHQYVLTVPEGRYSYRAVDGEQNLGGMCFDVPIEDEIMSDGTASGEGQVLYLRRVNFYTTNKNITAIGDYSVRLFPSAYPEAVMGAQYLDTSSRVITPVMALARGNALVYQGTVTLKEELGNTYGVASIVNYIIGSGTTASNKTFSLSALNTYTITTPADAKVQMFNQINNFNVEEIAQASETQNEDGTITHTFVGVGSNNTYRVSMNDKVTRAGYLANKAEDVVVTYEENENPNTTENAMDNSAMQRRMESSTLLNVNGQNNLKLATGDTFRLRAYRGAWQIINSDTANIMIEPDFNYEIISGNEHIKMTPATNKCTGNAGTGDAANWMDIQGVSAGTAIIEVSYDAIMIGGNGTNYDGLYGATDPQRTSLVVINVGETENILKMAADGSSNIWDTEYDTVYFADESGEITFTATLGEDAPEKVELSTDKGKTWTTVTAVEGKYTATGLAAGNNILKFTKGSTTEYQVVRAAKVTYKVENLSRKADYILEGDSVKIVYSGLYTPVSKFSGIYNPGFGQGHKVQYVVPEGVEQTATGGQYDFITTNTYTVVMGTNGKVTLDGGYIAFNVMGVADPLGGHRLLTDAGVGTNFSASSTQHTRSIMPDLTFDVVAMKSIPVTISTGEAEATIVVTNKAGETMTAENGVYTLNYGTYNYEITAEGYATERDSFDVGPTDGESKLVSIQMRKIEGNMWDGTSTAEVTANEDGIYEISTGAELAWFAAQVNAGTAKTWNAILTEDISLGGFVWTPIGNSSNAYTGTFDGNGHFVTDLYINSTENQQGLFGSIYNPAVIKNLGVDGIVTTTGNMAGGIVGQAKDKSSIENCVNLTDVTGKQYVGGIAGQQYMSMTISNCYNTGNITSTGGKNAGGISGGYTIASQAFVIENSYNTGKITATSYAGGVTYSTKAANGTNAFYLKGTCNVTTSKVGTEVTEDALKGYASTLGEAYVANISSYNNGYPILSWEESRALPVAQAEMIEVLNSYKNAEDYREAEAVELANVIADAKATIEAAKTMAEVTETVETAKAAMDAIKTASEYDEEEAALAQDKKNAVEELETYKNAEDYRPAQQKELAEKLEEGKAAIEAAATPEEVETALTEAKASLDDILTAEEIEAGIKFVDVASESYYFDAVYWAVDKGITSGTDDTHFSPDGSCTRAQAVTFLWRNAGRPEPETTENPFKDVSEDVYYYKAVLWASENGITSGKKADTFAPDETVTRGQAVSFLWRAAGREQAAVENPFKDISEDIYYYQAVLWAVEKGITAGTTETTFAPEDDCNRAQIVTFLYRANK